MRRTSNDTTYDNCDRIDLGANASSFVWDNLHSAFHVDPNGRFSSAGCQVVCGLPKSTARGNAPETGPWKTFIDTAYATFAAQSRFVYLLFTADELGVIANNDPGKVQTVVKFGSSGALVKKVQDALIASGELSGESDSDFGRQSLKALLQFQEKKFGPGSVDGVCGPDTAAALGVNLPMLNGAELPTLMPVPEQAGTDGPDIPDESDLAAFDLEIILAKLGLIPKSGAPAGTGAAPPPAPTPAAQSQFSHDTFFTDADRNLFSPPLNDAQRGGMREVLDYWLTHHRESDPRWLAYIFASIYHETGHKMIPVREGFKSSDKDARDHVRMMFIKGIVNRDYAEPVGGISYFGHGRVQTTHLQNYQKLSLRFGRDFVKDPSLLLDSRIDVEVAVEGHIEGLWTSRQLSEFISGGKCNYKDARRIVNGQDKADLIASYAVSFEWAIGMATRTVPVADTKTTTPLPEIGKVPASGQQGDTTMSDTNDVLARLTRISESLAVLLSTSSLSSATPGSDSGTEEARQQRIAAAKAVFNELSAGNPALSKVNGALGETMGKLLDCKKSAIGIIGALVTALVGGSTGDSLLGKLVGGVTSAAPILGGLSGPILPIFLAMSAWGVIGKFEKWNIGKRYPLGIPAIKMAPVCDRGQGGEAVGQ